MRLLVLMQIAIFLASGCRNDTGASQAKSSISEGAAVGSDDVVVPEADTCELEQMRRAAAGVESTVASAESANTTRDQIVPDSKQDGDYGSAYQLKDECVPFISVNRSCPANKKRYINTHPVTVYRAEKLSKHGLDRALGEVTSCSLVCVIGANTQDGRLFVKTDTIGSGWVNRKDYYDGRMFFMASFPKKPPHCK